MGLQRRLLQVGARIVLVFMLLVGVLLPQQALAAPLAVSHSLNGLTPTSGQPGASANFYKFNVTADGLYRLTYANLQAAGLPVDTLDPATLQVFEQGQELAITVIGEGDGQFDPGDFILFYGRKVETQYSVANVYWLTFDVQNGLRMAVQDVAPAGAPALSTFSRTLHLEQNVLYKGELPKEGLADRWYWQSYSSRCNYVEDPPGSGNWICQRTIPVLNYNLDLPTLSLAGGQATLEASLRGNYAEFLVNPDHHVLFFANGSIVGEGAWDAFTLLTPDADTPVIGAGSYDWEGNANPAGNCVLTGPGGNFFFDGLSAGSYVVDLPVINFHGGVLTGWKASPRNVGQASPVNQSTDLADDSDGALATSDAGLSLANGEVFMKLDFGFFTSITGTNPGTATTTPYVPNGSAAVGDRVWYDADEDGIQDAGELGIQGVLACLYHDDGNGYFNGPVTFSQDLLIRGSNVISFSVPQDSGAVQDTGYVDWIELTYQSEFKAEADRLPFNVDQTGDWSVHATGFTSDSIWLVDTSVPQAPVLLAGGVVSANGPAYDLSFQHTTTGPASYWAVGQAALTTPSNIRLDIPSDLLNPSNQADWVVVSHAAFLVRPATATIGPPAFPVPTQVTCPAYPLEQDTTYVECLSPPEQLARHRQSYSGLTTLVLDVQDVYDQFNGGLIHPEALHQLALFMRDSWQTPAPRYLLLVGDGHYDPLNFKGNSSPVYIPPYLAPIDLIIGEVAAMNRIVSEWPNLGGTPQVPFMGLGLFPANSLAQAQTMVNKTISYETTPILDGWNTQMTFVADDQDVAGNYPLHLNEVADDPAHLPLTYQAQKIYYLLTHMTPNAVTDATIDAINAGTLFVNYAGHGSNVAWSGERLLEISDIPAMTNADRLSIFLPMTCLEGNYIVPNSAAFAESVVRHAGGGAVATWSATGRGVSTGHQEILTGFYEALFGHGLIRLGDITTYAKQKLFDSGSFFKDLLDTYLIFGDPAVAVQVPQADLAAEMTLEGTTWEPGTPVTMTIHYSSTGVIDASGSTLSLDLPPAFQNWSWTGDPGVTLAGGTTFSLGDLPPGSSGTLVLTGILGQAASGTVLNFQAEAATSAAEGHLGDNTASAQATLVNNAGTITGLTWLDTDADGQVDSGELPLDDVVITLRDAGNVVVGTVLTDSDGLFTFSGLAPGSYTVEAAAVPGFASLSATSVTIGVVVGEITTVNFSYTTTTGVSILAFNVQRQGDAAVISWLTGDESGVFGYNIYRSSATATYGTRVNGDLILATGDGLYVYRDSGAGNDLTYYWIEVVDATGSQFLGPWALPAAGNQGRFRLFMPLLRR